MLDLSVDVASRAQRKHQLVARRLLKRLGHGLHGRRKVGSHSHHDLRAMRLRGEHQRRQATEDLSFHRRIRYS